MLYIVYSTDLTMFFNNNLKELSRISQRKNMLLALLMVCLSPLGPFPSPPTLKYLEKANRRAHNSSYRMPNYLWHAIDGPTTNALIEIVYLQARSPLELFGPSIVLAFLCFPHIICDVGRAQR